MLDHIDAGVLLEQPAGEDAVPFGIPACIAALVHENLHECPGLYRRFPRRGALAGGKADDDIVHTPRFARRHFDVAGKVVALVDEADGRNPLRHGRADALRVDDFGHRFGGDFFGNLSRFGLRRGRAFIARGERQSGDTSQNAAPVPHASGVQAS
ncbi:hypothetical protein BMF35_a0998 [Aurantiacibacter gangjinensis]|nr:hypothetical protein BMF35_a0998 [Aurantiacibacter gangjinensis]